MLLKKKPPPGHVYMIGSSKEGHSFPALSPVPSTHTHISPQIKMGLAQFRSKENLYNTINFFMSGQRKRGLTEMVSDWNDASNIYNK